jgi:hypothetical protein
LPGATDSVVQALERIDLSNAQKRDERFYPTGAIIVFNQKVRDAEPGAKGNLAGILKSSVLVEAGGKFVTVSNRLLDRLTICQTRELFVANGGRLNLKANRKLASGGRVTNGELVTVKSVRAGGDSAPNRLLLFGHKNHAAPSFTNLVQLSPREAARPPQSRSVSCLENRTAFCRQSSENRQLDLAL